MNKDKDRKTQRYKYRKTERKKDLKTKKGKTERGRLLGRARVVWVGQHEFLIYCSRCSLIQKDVKT